MRKTGSREIPPPLELECLRALWRIGDGTVKDVRAVLTENRNLAYTTVMTVLDRLVKRGSVERAKSGRSFVYTPTVNREFLRNLAVQELLDSLFDGSKEELIAFLEGQKIQKAEASRRPPKSGSEPPANFQPESIDTDLL